MAIPVGPPRVGSGSAAPAPSAPPPQPPVKPDADPRDRVVLGSRPDAGDIGYAKSLGGKTVQPLTKDDKERHAIYQDMTRGMDPAPDEKTSGKIESAMKGFSLDQLRKLQKNGVRFWIPAADKGNQPPDFTRIDVQASSLSSPAKYAPELYNQLEAEALKGGLPVPDRAALLETFQRGYWESHCFLAFSSPRC